MGRRRGRPGVEGLLGLGQGGGVRGQGRALVAGVDAVGGLEGGDGGAGAVEGEEVVWDLWMGGWVSWEVG